MLTYVRSLGLGSRQRGGVTDLHRKRSWSRARRRKRRAALLPERLLLLCRRSSLACELQATHTGAPRATPAPLVVAGRCIRALEAGTGRVGHEEKSVHAFEAAATALLPPNWVYFKRGRQPRLLYARGRERGVLLRLVPGLVTGWLQITWFWLRAGSGRAADRSTIELYSLVLHHLCGPTEAH